MYELRTREEFMRAIMSNEVVIIEYYMPGVKDSEYISWALRDIEKAADPRILFCRVNVNETPELAERQVDVPYVEAYYMGEKVFEHYGSLSSIDLNVTALRRGLRSVLKSLKVNIRV
ncbi:MAG: thioredoxin family protein [Desulfurococcus sp.]|nr:thioredoxin family protein [Desulfurococcus sp.]